MKKGLSILLIAAALFGFYGSAVNLNDILACKDYWEEAGEKSTADMNKLEDGLNQLKENEQAYLDGQEQLAEGEKTLADGEKQYAQGLKDYEAAPGKLKAGEKQLADGEDSYSDLKKLIAGLRKAQKHGVQSTKNHDTYWHDGFSNALKPGRKQIIAQLGSTAPMIGMLAGDDTVGKYINDKASYPNFDKDVQKLVKDIPVAVNTLKTYAGMASAYATDEALAGAATLLTDDDVASAKADASAAEIVAGVKEVIKQKTGNELSDDQVKAILSDSDTAAAYGAADYAAKYQALTSENKVAVVRKAARDTVAAQVEESPLYQMKSMLSSLSSSFPAVADLIGAMDALVGNTLPDAYYAQYIKGFQGGLATLADTLNGLATKLDGGVADLKKWDSGFQTLYHGKDGKISSEYPDDLASKTDGIPFAFKNMVTNKTIKAAIKKYDKGLMKILKKYSGDRLKNDSMEEFDEDIVYLSKKVIPRAQKVLAKVKADAAKQLAAGRKQLAQGRADYKAAPGKLADAEKQLADGRQQLADGKAQLAQYEDGEQQVRDGLAQLVGTEPDLELEGILDRLNGDGDFDDGDEHLDVDEGLNAVEVGRGYQADDGVLRTNEIMGRAVGTGALLGAGALAVLAAILSFLKKNKGAGVAALLAAAAGAFGAFYGTNAGTYFSDIAGSTAGNAAWIGAGILGAVALVHAIVHFTAKTDA